MPWASCGASQADARTHITGWQATFPCPLKGGFVARTPIQYFNVNVALLARKLDEWAAMPDEGT